MSENGKVKRKGVREPQPDASVLGAQPIRAWPWPRIVLYVPMFQALPYADDVFYDFMLIAQQGPPLLRAKYGRTDYSRNMAVEKFLRPRLPDGRPQFTHILMLDADHRHPQHIIQSLARWVIADPERQVVGGLNFMRGEPYAPCAFIQEADGSYSTPLEWEPGLMEVDILGTGCVLIAREVFERIPKPWFYYPYDQVQEGVWPTEDVGFSRKCNEHGIQLWMDTTTTSPHMISATIDESTFRAYVDEHAELAEMIIDEEVA